MLQGIYNNLILLIVMPSRNYYDYILKQQNMLQGIYNNLILLIVMPSRNYIHLKNNSFKQCNIICKRFTKVPNNAMMFA